MLTVHTTQRIAASGFDSTYSEINLSPYYYAPLRVNLPAGGTYDFKNYLYYEWPIITGPTEDTTIPRGIIETEPIENWKTIVGYSDLKENRLHNCRHQHVDGEISLYPIGRGSDPSPELCSCKPVSNWSFVVEIGDVTCLNSDEPQIDVATLDKNSNYVKMHAGRHIASALCWTDYKGSGGKMRENWLFADWGQIYVGLTGELGWKSYTDKYLYVRFFHVWEGGQLKTRKIWMCNWFVNNNLYQLRYIETESGTQSIYDFENTILLHVPDPGNFELRGPWSGTEYTVPDFAFLDALNYPQNTLPLLRKRFIDVPGMDWNADMAVGEATQQALLDTKALNINTIMYLKDYAEVGKLITAYTDLVTKGINPKTVASAWLATNYGIVLSVKDTKEIIKAAKRLKRKVEKAYAYSYGHASHVIKPGVKIEANVSIAYSQYDCKWLRFLSALSSLDVLPTPVKLWDMIPWSFVLDWDLPISEILETYDALIRSVVTRTYRACNSVKVTVQLDGNVFNAHPNYLCANGNAMYTYYRRTYTADPAFPIPWLGADSVSAQWNNLRFLNAGALIVQLV